MVSKPQRRTLGGGAPERKSFTNNKTIRNAKVDTKLTFPRKEADAKKLQKQTNKAKMKVPWKKGKQVNERVEGNELEGSHIDSSSGSSGAKKSGKANKKKVPWKKGKQGSQSIESRDDAAENAIGFPTEVHRQQSADEVIYHKGEENRDSRENALPNGGKLKVTAESSADELFKKGRFDDALKGYNKVMKRAAKTGDHTSAADALLRIANIHEGRGNLEMALAAHEKALYIYDMERKKIADNGGDGAHSFAVIAADTLAGIGNINVQMGEMDEAKENYQEALLEIQGLSATATTINLHKNIGKLLTAMGDYKAAIGAHTEVLKLQREVHGETHTDFADTLNDLGEILLGNGRRDQALEAFQETLMVYRINDLGNDHPKVNTVINNIRRALPDKTAAEEPKLHTAVKDLVDALNLECNDYICASDVRSNRKHRKNRRNNK